MIAVIDVRDLVGAPGTARETHLSGTLEDLGTEVARVKPGEPVHGDLPVESGGEGILGSDDYVGVDVHRAARIAAAAHGGQVIVSAALRGLVEDVLPAGVRLRELGTFKLKDLGRPETISQLDVDGLPTALPPLRTLDSSFLNCFTFMSIDALASARISGLLR